MFNKTIVLYLTTVSAVIAGTCNDPGKVHGVSGNFSVDLQGLVDTRVDTWGTASFVIKSMAFHPPVGCEVEVVKLLGDMVAWPLGEVPAGKQAGVLIGIHKSGEYTAKWADYCADGLFLYMQAGTSGQPVRIPFNTEVVDGQLNSDNVLQFKMAEWLNNTGLKIHMEVSFVVQFRFVEPVLVAQE